ncbi:MAG: radical SAM protein [Candidatus Accumulibacter sp.]|jgi:uncharacterized radical SAM superfamily Fe-S cluster-containing enzyme|nr:radical SAM protein [Accumulibacter sp.]
MEVMEQYCFVRKDILMIANENDKFGLYWHGMHNSYSGTVFVVDSNNRLSGIIARKELNFHNKQGGDIRNTPCRDMMNKKFTSVIRGHGAETKYRIIPVIETTGDFVGAYIKSAKIGGVTIDIGDACNLRCPCCPRGTRKMVNSKRKMPLDKFHRVIEKLEFSGVKHISLFNWTEPFLVSNLHEYIDQCAQFGINVTISTNLSIKKINHLRTVLSRPNLHKVSVSVSGFNADTHATYHRGSDIDVVKSHLSDISKMNLSDPSVICIKYLDFGYNYPEVGQMRNFANESGFDFVHFPAGGNPKSCPEGYTEKPGERELIPPPPAQEQTP